MANLDKYRVYCTTESAYVYWWLPEGSPAPTTCPNSGDHSVELSSVAISEQIRDQAKYAESGEQIIIPTAARNEYSSEPFGCDKGHIVASDYACPITLSNKSENGLTFTYNSDCPKIPGLGNYVFQDYFKRRSWIVAADPVNYTVTFESANLENGVGHYTIGSYIDSFVRDWKPPQSIYPFEYLWGIMISIESTGNIKDDFCELSVVDRDDLFLNDDFCRAVFGQYGVTTHEEAAPFLMASEFEFSEEYGGHWTKYYDENWAITANGKLIRSPDGAPGEMLPGLYLRLSYFTSKQDTTVTDVYVDYFMTSRS